MAGAVIAAPVVVVAKTLIIVILSKIFGPTRRDALRSGASLSPAGEFAFVLLPRRTRPGLCWNPPRRSW